MAISLSNDDSRLLAEYRFEVDSDSTSEDLNCTLCGKLVIDAYQTGCGCKYCCECIVRYMTEGNEYCLGSKEDCRAHVLVLDDNVTRNTALNDMVSRVRVHCPNQPCGFICQLAKMEDHLRVCDHQPIKCPYMRIGCCSEPSPRERMETHFQKQEVAHSELLVEVIDNLRNEIGVLKEEVASLKEQWSSHEAARREVFKEVETRLREFVRREIAAQENKFTKMLQDLKSELMKHFESQKEESGLEEAARRKFLEQRKEERERRRREMLEQAEEERRLQMEKMMREILDQVEEKMRIQKEELNEKFEDQKRELINQLDDQKNETERLKEKVKCLEEASADDEVKSRKIERLEEDVGSLKNEIDTLRRKAVEHRDFGDERLEAVKMEALKTRDDNEERSEESVESEDNNERRLEASKVETKKIGDEDEVKSLKIERLEEDLGSLKIETDVSRREAVENRYCGEETLETVQREAMMNRHNCEERSEESVESEDGNERRLEASKVETKKIGDEGKTAGALFAEVQEKRNVVLARPSDSLNVDLEELVMIGKLSFLVDGFREKVATNGEPVYSPYFYSHANGYKLRLRVHPGGDGGGRGTHLSVFLIVSKGEYDDELSWPCQHSVTVSTVNRLTREVYNTESISYCGTEHYIFEKPISTENPPVGWCSFVSHEDLESIEGLILSDSVLLLATARPPPIFTTSITISQFSRRKVANEIVGSQYFYSHTGGYKLRLRVHPGGDAGGRGTYMSVYSVVCKGEYDYMLPWPCKISLSVSIVNQLTKKAYETLTNNYCRLAKDFFLKPINKNNTELGWPSFVSHKDLDSIEGLIVNDSILLLVDVAPSLTDLDDSLGVEDP